METFCSFISIGMQ